MVGGRGVDIVQTQRKCGRVGKKTRVCDVQRPPCFEASKMLFAPPQFVGEELRLL